MRLVLLSLALIWFDIFQPSSDKNTIRTQNSSLYSIQKDTLKDSLIKRECKFIIHGIVQNQSKSIEGFQKKFGVGFRFKTCVIDPISYQKAITNNKNIAKDLTQKYGNSWVKELPLIPLGIK
jgi:hypothetical protein